jgi:hypothetical protein
MGELANAILVAYYGAYIIGAIVIVGVAFLVVKFFKKRNS